MLKSATFRTICIILILCTAASVFFGLLYHYDNKYTTANTVSQDGAVLLPDAQSRGVTWLVDGWHFYPDQLLAPGDNAGGGHAVYIGQYLSFAPFHADSSPYGYGSYRLRIRGQGQYTMLIPEVFCASVVYADGEPVASSGSIRPYAPQIQDLVFSFHVQGETEILIQTANHSHYYAGVTYPPAIASSQAIGRLIAVRMLFYGFLCFTSLALALFSAVVWCGAGHGDASAQMCWLGLLGLSFALRVCYPFIQMLALNSRNLAYILENTMAAFGLFCVTRTVCLICLARGALAERILCGIAAGFVVLAWVFSAWMTTALPAFSPVYGRILFWYKALIAGALTLLVIRRMWRQASVQTLLLLSGLLLYTLSLLCHALCFGRFEPAYTGWFEEWGAYMLILCFAARMALSNMDMIRRDRNRNALLQAEVARKTASLSKLLEERRMLLSGFAHDLKTPITSITTFTRLVELDNTDLDAESRQYLDIIRRKTRQIQDQLRVINEFTQADAAPPAFETLDLCRLLREFYDANEPDIQVNGVSLLLQLQIRTPVMIYADRRKLVSVLQNLVFNALYFTPEGGTIRLCLDCEAAFALLRIEDTGSGIAPEDMPHIFDQFFTNRKNGDGLGLFLTRSIITEHGGTIDVDSQPGKGSCFTIRLPIVQ